MYGLDALANLCGAEYQLERMADAERHARRGLELARVAGRGDVFPWMSQVLSGVLFVTGRLAESATVIDGIVEAARLTDNALGLAGGRGSARIHCVGSGRRWLRAQCIPGGSGAHPGFRPQPAGGVGRWHPVRGVDRSGRTARGGAQPRRRRRRRRAPTDPGCVPRQFPGDPHPRGLGIDHIPEAEATAELAQQRARRFGLDLSSASAELATAAVLMNTGQHRLAVRHALLAAERADRVSAPIAAGAARSLAGRALAAAGEKERAVAELERAVSATRRVWREASRGGGRARPTPAGTPDPPSQPPG